MILGACVRSRSGRRPPAVVGVWELLAAVERTRVAATLARVVAPVVRAGREGRRRRSRSGGGSRCSRPPRWPRRAGCSAGRRSRCSRASPGPVGAAALVRARRRRFRAALAASAPVVARALADALSAGHAVRGALEIAAAGVPGAAGHELGRGGAGAAARHADRGRARTPAPPRALRPAWDAMVAGILLQRDAGGDLPALLRDLALGLEAAARQDRDAIAATAQARFTARIVLVLPDRRRPARRARPAGPDRRPREQPDLRLAGLPRAAAAADRARRRPPPRPKRDPMIAHRRPHQLPFHAPARRDERSARLSRVPRRGSGPRQPRRNGEQATPRTGLRPDHPPRRQSLGSTPPAASPTESPPPASTARPARSSRSRPASRSLTRPRRFPIATFAPGRLGAALLLAAPSRASSPPSTRCAVARAREHG